MTHIIAYPTNAQEFKESALSGTDQGYFLFRVDQGDDGTTQLSVDAGMPFAVTKTTLRDVIYANTGVMLPTREEFRGKNISTETQKSFPDVDFNQLYTMATGPIPLLNKGDGKGWQVLLLQNDLTKPVNPGRWNFPSRLVSGTEPHVVLQQCMATEVGILTEFGNNHRVLPKLTHDFPALSAEQSISLDEQVAGQEANIKRELAKLGYTVPETITSAWRYVGVTGGLSDVLTDVQVNVLGNVFNTSAHVLLDATLNSANVHYPMLFNRLSGVVAVDPDVHGKNVALATFKEAADLDLIPAPRDFINRVLAIK